MTIPTFEDWHKDHAKYMEPADIVHWCKDAYESGKRDAVPEGYVIVPIEPTDDLCFHFSHRLADSR